MDTMSKREAGRAWTPEEDDAIRAACSANRSIGLTDENGGGQGPRWRARRLQAVADRFGRTLEAVRKRAQRLGERSYRPSWRRAPSFAAGREAEREYSRLRAADELRQADQRDVVEEGP